MLQRRRLKRIRPIAFGGRGVTGSTVGNFNQPCGLYSSLASLCGYQRSRAAPKSRPRVQLLQSGDFKFESPRSSTQHLCLNPGLSTWATRLQSPCGVVRSTRHPVTVEIAGSNPVEGAGTARYANRQSGEAQTFANVCGFDSHPCY